MREHPHQPTGSTLLLRKLNLHWRVRMLREDLSFGGLLFDSFIMSSNLTALCYHYDPLWA